MNNGMMTPTTEHLIDLLSVRLQTDARTGGQIHL